MDTSQTQKLEYFKIICTKLKSPSKEKPYKVNRTVCNIKSKPFCGLQKWITIIMRFSLLWFVKKCSSVRNNPLPWKMRLVAMWRCFTFKRCSTGEARCAHSSEIAWSSAHSANKYLGVVGKTSEPGSWLLFDEN